MRNGSHVVSVPPAKGMTSSVISADRSWWFLLLYSLAVFGMFVGLMTPILSTLPLRVYSLGGDAKALGAVLTAGSFIALVSTPVFGILSDKTRSSIGRRRPYILSGAIGSSIGVALIGTASNLAAIALGWCVVQLSFNAVLAVLAAILVDQVPATRRGFMSGVFGMSGPAGLMFGTYLVKVLSGSPSQELWAPELFSLVCLTAFFFVLSEIPVGHGDALSSGGGHWLYDFISDLRGERNFFWALASRFLLSYGSSIIMSYQALYLLHHFGVPADRLVAVIFKCTVAYSGAFAFSSILAGRICDLVGGHKRIVLSAAVIQGIGLLCASLSGSLGQFLTGLAIAGIGHGFYMGVDMALFAEVLPVRKGLVAKNLGICNMAVALSQLTSPAIGLAVLAASGGSYSLVYVVGAVLSVLAAVAVAPVSLRARP